MSDAVIEAVDAARAAYERATEALRLAEAAARVAEIEITPTVVDELTVKRVNVVEDDGTLRLVIGNSTMGRTLPTRGRLVTHPGRDETAGLLFVNDEGSECGGLTFGGYRGEHGKEQYAELTLDDYEQNEGFKLGMHQDGSGTRRWLEFRDMPGWSIGDLIDEVDGLDAAGVQEVQQRYDDQGVPVSRMRLAREADGSVGLALRDARGQDRLRFVVPADGEPVIEILDVDGVPRSLLPE